MVSVTKGFKKFEEIHAWKTARLLANLIYDLTERGSFNKDFALRDQIRRASISVLSNIAEAYGSRTRILFIDLLGRAKGSAEEVRAQLYLALDRQYIGQSDFDKAFDLADKAGAQIFHLINYLERQHK